MRASRTASQAMASTPAPAEAGPAATLADGLMSSSRFASAWPGRPGSDRDRQIEATANARKIAGARLTVRNLKAAVCKAAHYPIPAPRGPPSVKAHKAEGGQTDCQMCLDDHDQGVHAKSSARLRNERE